MEEGLAPNGYATIKALIKVAEKGSFGARLVRLVPNAEVGSDTPNNLTDRSGNPTKPYGRMIQHYIGTDTGLLTQCRQQPPPAGKKVNALTGGK